MKTFVTAALLGAIPFAASAQAPDNARTLAQLERSDHSEAARPANARKNTERSTRAFASAPSPRAFDGAWSVLIETRAGACDPTFRYGVDISNGNVINAGNAGGAQVQLAGHVAPSGAIRVSVASGDQQAQGVGRLSGGLGHGTWRGVGSRGVCAGTWEAERRG